MPKKELKSSISLASFEVPKLRSVSRVRRHCSIGPSKGNVIHISVKSATTKIRKKPLAEKDVHIESIDQNVSEVETSLRSDLPLHPEKYFGKLNSKSIRAKLVFSSS